MSMEPRICSSVRVVWLDRKNAIWALGTSFKFWLRSCPPVIKPREGPWLVVSPAWGGCPQHQRAVRSAWSSLECVEHRRANVWLVLPTLNNNNQLPNHGLGGGPWPALLPASTALSRAPRAPGRCCLGSPWKAVAYTGARSCDRGPLAVLC